MIVYFHCPYCLKTYRDIEPIAHLLTHNLGRDSGGTSYQFPEAHQIGRPERTGSLGELGEAIKPPAA